MDNKTLGNYSYAVGTIIQAMIRWLYIKVKEKGRGVSVDCYLWGWFFVDGDVLEALLDDLQDLLALTCLKAVFAVLADLTL